MFCHLELLPELDWYYITLRSVVVPELHVGPFQPGLHLQTSGETHSPPFSQCLLHTTETDNDSNSQIPNIPVNSVFSK